MNTKIKTEKTALVTGGAGFIGSHIVDHLIAEGFSVRIIDNFSGGKKERVNPRAELYESDLTKYADIENIFNGIRYVFHTAAMPRAPYSIEKPIETNEANVNATLNVLHAAKECGVKRVIYSASSSAYGNQPTMPLRENMTPHPMSPYGLQKHVGEQYCRIFSDLYGLETVCLRYFNVYGPRLDPEGDYALVIGKFLKQIKEGKPLTVTGDGKQSRDFTHVKDVARANILAMLSDKVGKGDVINIGGGKNHTINDLAAVIGGPVVHVEPRVEPAHSVADITKAKELLGWQPEISLEQGLAELKEIFCV